MTVLQDVHAFYDSCQSRKYIPRFIVLKKGLPNNFTAFFIDNATSIICPSGKLISVDAGDVHSENGMWWYKSKKHAFESASCHFLDLIHNRPGNQYQAKCDLDNPPGILASCDNMTLLREFGGLQESIRMVPYKKNQSKKKLGYFWSPSFLLPGDQTYYEISEEGTDCIVPPSLATQLCFLSQKSCGAGLACLVVLVDPFQDRSEDSIIIHRPVVQDTVLVNHGHINSRNALINPVGMLDFDEQFSPIIRPITVSTYDDLVRKVDSTTLSDKVFYVPESARAIVTGSYKSRAEEAKQFVRSNHGLTVERLRTCQQFVRDHLASFRKGYDDPKLFIITTASGVRKAADDLRGSLFVAFDTEDSMDPSKRVRVCVLSLQSSKDPSTLIVIWAKNVDVWNAIRDELAPIFSDPSIIKLAYSVQGIDQKVLHSDFFIHVVGGVDLQLHAIGSIEVGTNSKGKKLVQLVSLVDFAEQSGALSENDVRDQKDLKERYQTIYWEDDQLDEDEQASLYAGLDCSTLSLALGGLDLSNGVDTEKLINKSVDAFSKLSSSTTPQVSCWIQNEIFSAVKLNINTGKGFGSDKTWTDSLQSTAEQLVEKLSLLRYRLHVLYDVMEQNIFSDELVAYISCEGAFHPQLKYRIERLCMSGSYNL